MVADDVDGAAGVWQEALADLRRRSHLPVGPATPDDVERTRRRLRYFLATDPGGSWVAASSQGVVGVAQAMRRDRLWVLSLLGVALAAQGRGLGGHLLAHSLRYADPNGRAVIFSSSDPRAMRCYSSAGFALHPVVAATGRVRTDRLAGPARVRDGSPADAEFAATVDMHLRGAGRGSDLQYLADDGVRMLVVDGGGYAMVRGGQPVLLGAFDEAAARDLLMAALRRAAPDEHVEVNWLSAEQQWAIQTALTAGLELRGSGAIMIRGFDRPPAPCIPSGALG